MSTRQKSCYIPYISTYTLFTYLQPYNQVIEGLLFSEGWQARGWGLASVPSAAAPTVCLDKEAAADSAPGLS